jgi:DeoR/GlpR family transcriptional regulator of sugar metabolism
MRYERSLAIASRHEKLIELIRSGEFSSRVLAKRLEVSEQTIYRDIDSLKERGYSIRSVRLSKGWAYKLQGEPTPIPSGKRS